MDPYPQKTGSTADVLRHLKRLVTVEERLQDALEDAAAFGKLNRSQIRDVLIRGRRKKKLHREAANRSALRARRAKNRVAKASRKANR